MSDSMHRSLDAAIGRQVPAEQVETLANRCICGHAFEWHHDQRGCQYHGNGKGRCRCLRDVPTAVEDSPWLADRLAEARLLGRYEMGVGARPGCDDPEGLLAELIARERAEAAREAWDDASELADSVIVSWQGVPGLHPEAQEPHPAAIAAAGARRTLVVLRSRMVEAFRARAARIGGTP